MQEMLTYAMLSSATGIKIGTLYAMVSQGRIPHVRIGKRFVRFRRQDIDAWIADHVVQTSEKQTGA